MFLVTAEQMGQAEAAANESGYSYEAMMESAGESVADAIEQEFGAAGRQVLVLVGPGNNGGDGLVAARYLADKGAFVKLYIWKRSNLDDDRNWQRLKDYALPVCFHEQDPAGDQLADLVLNSAIVVDALLGTGVSRPITGSLAELLTVIRAIIDERRAKVVPRLIDPIDPDAAAEAGPALVAVDLPSGLQTDSGELDPLTLPADLTITFAAPKLGQFRSPGAAYVGQLLVADIGLDEEHFPPGLPQLATPALIAELLPERSIFGHKGSFGKVLVVAGSANYAGAPALAATAAYRTGAGLVTVAVPASIQPLVAGRVIEATYLLLAHEAGAVTAAAVPLLEAAIGGYEALLVGPGLGTAPVTADFLQALLELLAKRRADLPSLVFDADALNLLAKEKDWWLRLPPWSILTPHPGEMSRLTGRSIREVEADRLEMAAAMARKWQQVVVLKGAYTVVASPEGAVTVLPFANPALATAGSGDVLAGTTLGLLGQKLAPFAAAVAGAYLHGLAGEMAREDFWEAGVMAGDLLERLPLALKEIALG